MHCIILTRLNASNNGDSGLSQGNGVFPQDLHQKLTQLVDDLRLQMASYRSEERQKGNDFPPQIMKIIDELSQTMDDWQDIFYDYEIEKQNLEALVQISQVINSSLDRTKVLNEVVDTIIRLIGAERAFLMLRNSTGELEIVTARNWERESLQPHEFEISQSIIAQVMHEGEAVVTTNAQTDPRFGHQVSVITYSLRSILCVPLIVKDAQIGVIYTDNRIREGLFTEKDCTLLSVFANQAAVAIENAQLYEAVRQHAQELECRVEERTAELAEANHHLRILSRLKDEFVANVSHELRTPISSLKLYGSLLDAPGDSHNKYQEAMKREVIRLEHIIESLLHLSSFDQDQIAINLTPLDLNDLAELLIHDRILLAQSRDLDLSFEGASDLAKTIADQELITEAVSILLTNALNYTPAGGKILVKTESQMREDEEWLAIHVIDSGHGLPKKEIPQLFQRFFRGKVGRESGYAGTGLGLSIVKEIVERNGGIVEARNNAKPVKGATFSIWLPSTASN
jgi:signal transduction histidine kinase